jgi:hypothetical protein
VWGWKCAEPCEHFRPVLAELGFCHHRAGHRGLRQLSFAGPAHTDLVADELLNVSEDFADRIRGICPQALGDVKVIRLAAHSPGAEVRGRQTTQPQ